MLERVFVLFCFSFMCYDNLFRRHIYMFIWKRNSQRQIYFW